MIRLLASRARHAGAPILAEDVFARHMGRRRRGYRPLGSLTGWSFAAVVARLEPVVKAVDDFTRPRSTPLALCPPSDDVIPFATPARYTRPYSPKDAA